MSLAFADAAGDAGEARGGQGIEEKHALAVEDEDEN